LIRILPLKTRRSILLDPRTSLITSLAGLAQGDLEEEEEEVVVVAAAALAVVVDLEVSDQANSAGWMISMAPARPAVADVQRKRALEAILDC
jgi:hypothetical protein